MGSERLILLVGGAPRVPVDAIRHLTVGATGATSVALAGRLRDAGRETQMLLSLDAAPGVHAARYGDRESLEEALAAWIGRHPDGCVVMSAAVNDYRVAQVERWEAGEVRATCRFEMRALLLDPEAKIKVLVPGAMDAATLQLSLTKDAPQKR